MVKILAACLAAAAFAACPHSSGGGGDDEPALPPAIKSLTLEQIPEINGFAAVWETETPVSGLSYDFLYNESGTPPAVEASGVVLEDPRAEVRSGLGGGKTYSAWVRAVLGGQKGEWSDTAAITLLRDQTDITLSIEVFGQTRFAARRGNVLEIRVPVNTPLPWEFSPSIALAEGAELVSAPGAGEAADFSDPASPVHYHVQAENGRVQDYTVDMAAGDESGLDLREEPRETAESLFKLAAPVVLSKAQKQTKALVLDAGEFSNFAWYVDGIRIGTTNGIRLSAVNYEPGLHYLGVSAFRSYTNGEGGEDRVPWSFDLVFTVTE
jgi:hypothetical protein